jgi:hypothetical protein
MRSTDISKFKQKLNERISTSPADQGHDGIALNQDTSMPTIERKHRANQRMKTTRQSLVIQRIVSEHQEIIVFPCYLVEG